MIWFRRSACQKLPLAQVCLAIGYEDGLGTRVDLPRALRLYRRAAAQGDTRAAEGVKRLEGNPAATRRCALPSCRKPESERRGRRLLCCGGGCKGTEAAAYYCSPVCQAADEARHAAECQWG